MSSVVVTGACGFIGCNVVERLLQLGRDVVAIDREAAWPPDASERFAALPGRLSFAAADVRDPRTLADAFAHGSGPITGLVHAAAITPGPEREAHDATLIAEVNALGTLRVLETARAAGVGRVLFTSSASVYGDAAFPDDGLLREGRDAPLPNGVYGIAKYAAERFALRARSLWGLDVVALRIGGAFGPWERDSGWRDTFSGPMLLTRGLLRGERVRAAPGGHHDWVYAPDVADAIVALLTASRPAHELYHVSGGAHWTAADWLEAARASLDRRGVSAEPTDVAWTLPAQPRPRAALSIERLRPHHTPRFGLTQAVEHYLDWLAQRSSAWHALW